MTTAAIIPILPEKRLNRSRNRYKPREVFKNELLDRIKLGEDFIKEISSFNGELDVFNTNVSSWDDYNEELIKRSFNNQDSEYKREYSRVNNGLGMYDYLNGVNTDTYLYKIKSAKERVENCLIWLKRLVDKLPLIEEEQSISQYQVKEKMFYNRGFIVHGRNSERKLEVARYVDIDLRKKAVILHEQPNKGQTIIEKFESHSSVDFAIALWTADDVGKSKSEEGLKDRARQNVVFETGFFIGKLGRGKVIVLYEHGVEIPSDYSGIVFIPLADNWKDDLRKEIEEIYKLD